MRHVEADRLARRGHGGGGFRTASSSSSDVLEPTDVPDDLARAEDPGQSRPAPTDEVKRSSSSVVQSTAGSLFDGEPEDGFPSRSRVSDARARARVIAAATCSETYTSRSRSSGTQTHDASRRSGRRGPRSASVAANQRHPEPVPRRRCRRSSTSPLRDERVEDVRRREERLASSAGRTPSAPVAQSARIPGEGSYSSTKYDVAQRIVGPGCRRARCSSCGRGAHPRCSSGSCGTALRRVRVPSAPHRRCGRRRPGPAPFARVSSTAAQRPLPARPREARSRWPGRCRAMSKDVEHAGR